MQDYIFKAVDDGTYAVMSYKGNDTEVTIPATHGGQPVTIINDNLFAGHSEIEKVNLPDTITNIGGFVFDGCDKLKAVKLPASLQEMWQYAFTRSGIEVVEIPGTVKSVVPFVFNECPMLTMVICHEGTRNIRANAFRNCPNLKMVVVHSATEVSHLAFEGCPQIDPNVRTKLKSTCKCPQCSGDKKIDVLSMLRKNRKK